MIKIGQEYFVTISIFYILYMIVDFMLFSSRFNVCLNNNQISDFTSKFYIQIVYFIKLSMYFFLIFIYKINISFISKHFP